MKRLTLTAVLLVFSLCKSNSQQVHDVRLAKSKKVFVFPLDRKTTSSIKHDLTSWGYWQVVDDVSAADFILRFNFDHKSFGDRIGYVEFLDPSTNIPFETTYECDTEFSLTPNKRKLAKKIIRKRIKRDFTSRTDV